MNSTRTPEEARIIAERDDKAMIENPQLWPCWPVLPVVNRGAYDPEHPLGNDGLIMSGRPTVVVLSNMFMRRVVEPCIEYESVDALLAAGWTVD